ncbi:MAG: DUF885 domain-containing protein [Acidobacteria bacterium]|nr:DUF885 domain-containing protein [Acidobacteriota bacterium]
MHPSEPFPQFVEDYLAHLYEFFPGQASQDGIHRHDDVLENFSRLAIETHIRALGGFSRRLQHIDAAPLQPGERIDRRILAAAIESRMYELETLGTWTRSSQLYAAALVGSLAGQTLSDHAPAVERARRVVSKLRQTPRLVDAARDNIAECSGLSVKVSLEAWRSAATLIEVDLPRAFSDLDDLHILGDLADASSEASEAVAAYVRYLESDLAPRAKASIRLGREVFERKLQLEEGIALDAERLLAIASRELDEVQEEFRSVAGRLNGGDPIAAWRKAQEQHPDPGQLVPVVQQQVEDLSAFLERQGVVSLPASDRIVVAASPASRRSSLSSVRPPGPFESRPGAGRYHVTDADRRWPQERQAQHMRDLNLPRLWSLSINKVYPGRYLQSQHLRRVESKVRKSTLLASMSFVKGWAHYGEQMMVEAGFGHGDAAIRLGQLAESLVGLARVVVAVRLHCDDLSVEQGMRIFRDEAYLEERVARQEAERATFDDTAYLAGSLGRLMMLKLRRDYKSKEPGTFSIRTFHDTVLAHGNAPFWAHRDLLFDNASGAVLE